MKYLVILFLTFICSLFANQQNGINEDYAQMRNNCISGNALACNLLGNMYFDTSKKESNIFIGIILHDKACKSGNKESCKIISDFKNKNYKSILNENELKILNFLVEEELSNFLKENEPDTVFKEYYNPKKNHINTTANSIQLDYEKNEVGADLKYRNKDIILSGEVLTISKNAFGSIYLDLKGGTNQFITPKANIDKKFIEWASKLSKKDKVNLFCEKSSMIIGSVVLDDCKPLNIVINEKVNNIIRAIDKNALRSLNSNWLKTGVTIKEVSKLLKNNSKCYTSNNLNNCIKDISSVLSKNEKQLIKINQLIK